MAPDPLDEVEHVAEEVLSTLRDDLLGRDGYLVVLILTMVSLIIIPVDELFRGGTVMTALVIGLLVLVTMTRSKVPHALRVVSAIVVLAAVVLAAVASVLDITAEDVAAGGSSQWLAAAGTFAYALVLALCFPAILRQALRQRKVTLNTVTAALAAYLLLGLVFTEAYRFVNIVSGPFFVQTGTSGFTYEYFSYVTLTTVGYGDYTAANNAGRTLAMIEALIGQVFLVTIVAVVVSNLGTERKQLMAPGSMGALRPRRRRGRNGEAGTDVDDQSYDDVDDQGDGDEAGSPAEGPEQDG